jgi:hypothetical protein
VPTREQVTSAVKLRDATTAVLIARIDGASKPGALTTQKARCPHDGHALLNLPSFNVSRKLGMKK